MDFCMFPRGSPGTRVFLVFHASNRLRTSSHYRRLMDIVLPRSSTVAGLPLVEFTGRKGQESPTMLDLSNKKGGFNQQECRNFTNQRSMWSMFTAKCGFHAPSIALKQQRRVEHVHIIYIYIHMYIIYNRYIIYDIISVYLYIYTYINKYI